MDLTCGFLHGIPPSHSEYTVSPLFFSSRRYIWSFQSGNEEDPPSPNDNLAPRNVRPKAFFSRCKPKELKSYNSERTGRRTGGKGMRFFPLSLFFVFLLFVLGTPILLKRETRRRQIFSRYFCVACVSASFLHSLVLNHQSTLLSQRLSSLLKHGSGGRPYRFLKIGKEKNNYIGATTTVPEPAPSCTGMRTVIMTPLGPGTSSCAMHCIGCVT
jgi:hypothetical protein